MSQLIDKEIDELFLTVPEQAREYASIPEDLDLEDIPEDRIPKLLILMHEDHEYHALKAAMILTSWINEEGFDYLERFVLEHPVLDGWMEHRLRGYDDTYRHVLSAYIAYWAHHATINQEDGEHARHKIFKPVSKIIEYSNTQRFEINEFFWVVKKYQYTEYIPLLKQHLEAIAQNPRLHHWKIVDCAKLLSEFDPEFVQSIFDRNHLNPADFEEKK